MMLALLLACGVDGPLDQPLPPPTPPPVLVTAEPDVVRQAGVVSEVHGPTRSFVLTGEGKRVIVHLRDSGTLKLGGQPSQVQDLQAGTTLWVEGKRQGDLLVVLRAADTEGGADMPAAAPVEGTVASDARATEPSVVEGTAPVEATPAANGEATTTPASTTPATPTEGGG